MVCVTHYLLWDESIPVLIQLLHYGVIQNPYHDTMNVTEYKSTMCTPNEYWSKSSNKNFFHHFWIIFPHISAKWILRNCDLKMQFTSLLYTAHYIVIVWTNITSTTTTITKKIKAFEKKTHFKLSCFYGRSIKFSCI